jgi:hypothetical protein
MAAGHAIPRARNGDEVCEEKRETQAGPEEGGMGVLCRNAEHSIATLVWTGPWSFFNHASKVVTERIRRCMVWRHKTLHPASWAIQIRVFVPALVPRHTSHRPMTLLQKE